MSRIISLVVYMVALMFATSSTAAIILSQSPPGTAIGVTSDFAASFINQQAQRVELSADANVGAVVAWGSYNGSAQVDNFTVRFFVDAGGVPAATHFYEQTTVPVLREATGIFNLRGDIIYKYTFNLVTPAALTAATTYYISVVNNTSSSDHWSWSPFAGGGSGLRWHRSSTTWTSTTPPSLAFELSDTPIVPPVVVPPESVPAMGNIAIGLLAAMLLLVGALGSRRQKE